MEFEWDSNKARRNLHKQNVSFEEAATVFDDPLASYYEDPDHSSSERRYLTIGKSDKEHLIHVSFADRAGRTRIIHAKAS